MYKILHCTNIGVFPQARAYKYFFKYKAIALFSCVPLCAREMEFRKHEEGW